MKQTGELLKSTREAKKLSLHEIGMSLKINPKTLQAIEEGDLKKLPQRTFLRGFVKSYTQYLKLDVKQTMETFDREQTGSAISVETAAPVTASEVKPEPPVAPVVKNIPKLSERAPNHIDRSKEARTQKTLLLIGGVVLAIVIVAVAKVVNKYQKERGGSVAKTEVAKLQEAATPADAAPTLVEPTITGASVTPAVTPSTPTSTTAAMDHEGSVGTPNTATLLLPTLSEVKPVVAVAPTPTPPAPTPEKKAPAVVPKKVSEPVAATTVNDDEPAAEPPPQR